jgi:beta-lactam-binding protein with PASTA domain
VSAVVPAAGSVSGGTKVTITGANFAEVKAVSFGETPAVSFKVESESRITALSPASGTLGETGLTVGTVAGNAAGTFTYRGCLVPRLRGKGLAAARRLLAQAGCRVGALRTSKGKPARHGRIIGQTPRPATVLPPGARVSLVLR